MSRNDKTDNSFEYDQTVYNNNLSTNTNQNDLKAKQLKRKKKIRPKSHLVLKKYKINNHF